MPQSPGRVFDEYLVLRAQAGDRTAAERLAVRWRPRLLRTARRLADKNAAEDIVQDTWLGLAKALPSLRDPSRFPAFAFRILHRRCAEHIATKSVQQGRSAEGADELENVAAAPAADRGSAFSRTAINAAFASLSADQRTAATLFFGEGLSLQEISAVTGAPIGTVKSRLFHARQKLKTMLEGDLT